MNSIEYHEWARFLKYLSEHVCSFYYPYHVPGGRILLDITESPMMLARALGRYEVAKHRAIASILRPGDVMIDVGANKGDFSLLAAKCVESTGDVLAFEPEPTNCEWISRSVQLNGYANVRVIPVALADRNGSAPLYLGDRSGWHSLKANGNDKQRSISVEQCRLDDFLTERHDTRPIRLMKIDVEGAELEVLRGAVDTLKHNDVAVVMDVHPHLGVDVAQVVGLLKSLGFHIFAEDPAFAEPISNLNGVNSFVAKKVG